MFECSSWLSAQIRCTRPTPACGPNMYWGEAAPPGHSKILLSEHILDPTVGATHLFFLAINLTFVPHLVIPA